MGRLHSFLDNGEVRLIMRGTDQSGENKHQVVYRIGHSLPSLRQHGMCSGSAGGEITKDLGGGSYQAQCRDCGQMVEVRAPLV